MNAHRSLRLTPAACCLAGAFSALAADPFEEDLIQDHNRLSVAARFSFGISAQVRNLSVPQPAAPDYHDGFVRPDINGSADGKTWYWGYQADNQIVGDDLQMHTATGSPSDGQASGSGDDLQAGFEVMYGRELGRLTLGKRRLPWGIEAGVSSLNSKIEIRDTYSGAVSVRTDSYALNGVVPPRAPYSGTYEGPGPLVSAAPHASRTDSVNGTSAVDSRIDSLLVGLKVGPFIEMPLSDRLQVNLSAGVAALATFNDFDFTETVSIPGLPNSALDRSGETSDTGFVVGAYVEASVSYAISEFLSVFVGGQYQYLGDVDFSGGGKEATLELSSAIEAVIGLRTSF
jgi:hypothetical protein